MAVSLFVVSAALAPLLLAACGDTNSTSAGGTSQPAGGAASNIERGKAVFARYCNSCHPGGGLGAGPSLLTLAGTWSDVELTSVVRNGKNRMPAFTQATVSDDDLAALVMYIRTLKAP